MKNNDYHNEWFRNYLLPENYGKIVKKIGLHMSGGVDSALMAYLTAKFIYDNNLKDVKIVPVHGWNRKEKSYFYSPTVVRNILNVIRPLFPTVQIDNVYLYAYDKLEGDTKSKYALPNIQLLHKEKIVDGFAYGSTREPPAEDLKEMGIESIGRTELIRKGGPVGAYTKKDVAELYNKHNLMDNLFPVTVSCVGNEPITHCKICWWCKERYWAFGRY